MTTMYEIPLTPAAQTFSIALAGVTYQIYLYFNSYSNNWNFDISDSSGNPLVQGIALVTGADLLGQYTDLNFGGTLYCTTDGDPSAIPTGTNLGTSSHVVFITP